jgi:hypothetical protein
MTGFIGTSLKLQPIITAHDQWHSKTRSIPYWTTSVCSSTVIDFVLIYESVTSSASVVRWLTLHSWTLNYSYELCLPNRYPAMGYSASIHCRGNMLTEPLPSNGHIHHIAPSSRLFVPNSLSGYHRSFFSEVSACDDLRLGVFCGDYSPTAPNIFWCRCLDVFYGH